ncbi:MAG: UbiX family flavin prenyltransferase [Candidatus Micrarchaeota archaeon]|nr:UbiX family flavin prenyltransferase [Candidatus Micrarchaeota archaeon]
MKVILAITGASGVPIGMRLAKALRKEQLSIVVSENAKKVIKYEVGDVKKFLAELSKYGRLYDEAEIDAPPASGSSLFDAMVVCPCSMKTLSAIASGYCHNLITRSADVMLKEGRRLILVPRETPLNAIHLENMLKLSRIGVVILPASPAFYHRPKKVEDMVDFIVGKILDSLRVENHLYKRWN